MPVILPPETHEQWLSGESGKEILRPFPAKEMTARPISKRINKPENNDPSAPSIHLGKTTPWISRLCC
jgi:putative SOS response-associated peptidase YedK